jgi:hypothetical protein
VSDARHLVVRNGDLVRITGQVIAAPDQPVIYCARLVDGLIGPTSCPDLLAVELNGIDIRRLAGVTIVNGVQFGYATVIGTWRNRVIHVRQQTEPLWTRHEDAVTWTAPCPPPHAGWQRGVLPDLSTLKDYLNKHADRFGKLWITSDVSTADDGTMLPPTEYATQIVVVPVMIGNLADAHRELAAIYDGNLCLTRGKLSINRAARARAALEELMSDKENGILMIGGMAASEKVSVGFVVLSDQLHMQFSKIGLDVLELQPLVVPVS